jgi:(p)ppGpp synthase/HD superfamily hydrolase
MSDKEILDFVKEYADRSHGTQVRKYTGERYIGHPLRVMETVREYCDEVSVLAASLLHDVLEDTRVTANEMEEVLSRVMAPDDVKKTTQIVIELTDIFVKTHYPRMNRRSRKEKEAARLSSVSPEAQTVKYADIIDNVVDIVKQDADFARVFVKEAKKMLTMMESGDARLREKALLVVDEGLESIRNFVGSTSGR